MKIDHTNEVKQKIKELYTIFYMLNDEMEDVYTTDRLLEQCTQVHFAMKQLLDLDTLIQLEYQHYTKK